MTQRDEAKLKIVSAIDDDIIEKNAQKRYELWQTAGKRRPPSYYWIRWGAAAACLLAVLIGVFGFFALFSKQAPIYRGMTVSGSSPSTVASVAYFHAPIRLAASVPLSGTRPLNGTEDVTTDTEAVSETEDAVLQPESSEPLYYARPGEKIYITVHFDNPDQFEIISFTLNGEKKQVGMAGFEVGYDLQTVTVPMIVSADAAGVIEYTIDAIKYMDGTETKDVRMEGDDTVHVGVYTEKQPVATVAEETVGFNDISFNMGIADEKTLITACNGTAYALLYEGEEIIAEQVLSVQNENHVSFHGLKTNASYRYVVVANYDPLDGEGKRELMLFEKRFSTKPILWFESVTTTQTDAAFSLVWDEAFANRQLTSLTLFHGADSTELDVAATSVSGLLSDNEYRLVATYLNGGAKESVECSFKTKAKTVPTVTVTEKEKTQTSLEFDVAVTDPDALCTVEKIELLHGGDAPIAAENTDIRAFAGLLSNNQYTIKVTYTYDLNDGEGVHTESADVNIKTVAKTAPTVKVSETEKTQTSLKFDVAVTDPDALCTVEKIELLHGTDAPIVAEDTDVRTFAGLLSNNQYTVKVTYAYDLNDGVGLQENTALLKTVTMAREIVVEDIRILGDKAILPGTSVSLVIDVNNPDDVQIKGFTINGVYVNVTRLADNIYSGEYVSVLQSGVETLKCERLEYVSFGMLVEQEAVYTSDATLAILGKISIKELKTEKECFKDEETVVTTIVFEGSEAYSMKNVKVDSFANFEECPLTKINDTTYTFRWTARMIDPGVNGFMYVTAETFKIDSVTYGIGDTTTTVKITDSPIIPYCAGERVGDTVIDISTPEELQDMTNYNSYRLVNDIDLSGFDWRPYGFSGSLDGNGYTIYNLTIDEDYVGKETESVGMFTYFNGYMKDVILKNAEIRVIADALEDVGFLCGRAGGGVFSNCHVEGDMSIIIRKGKIENLGGLVGSGYGADGISVLKQCSYRGSVKGSYLARNQNPLVATFLEIEEICAIDCTAYSNLYEEAAVYGGFLNCEFYPLEK